MSKFRTIIPDTFFPFEITQRTGVMCLGSCFAEHIESLLKSHKFSTDINPFGIIYNPFSIANSLEFLIHDYVFQEKDLFETNGLWNSFHHHSSFSTTECSKTLHQINDTLEKSRAFLAKAQKLIITFGTSNVFTLKKDGSIVANCHKLPNELFNRKALSVEFMVEKLNPLFQQLKENNPALDIILTVSPVRHIRDGFIKNQRSKSRLLLTCEALVENLDYVHYFPSYELLMDDLRDYRFYNTDMLHPSAEAIDYIWQYFGRSFFTNKTESLNRQINALVKASMHRPLHPGSTQHQHFVKTQLDKIQALTHEFEYLDFSTERKLLESQLL